MFNKLKFNNLAISNKKKIQQSRIQTINKLVQKIRKLKSVLEKRPDNEKTKDRIRKTTETMEQLKKLKRIELMKRILLLDKSPAAIITNGRALPEEIAVAMLAMNKIMQGLSNQFKEELNLMANDESWRYAITQLSKRRIKINRTEEKRQNRKVSKEQKVLTRKRVEWLQENVHGKICKVTVEENSPEEEEDTKNFEKNVSTMGEWKVESVDVEKPKPKQKVVKPVRNIQKQNIGIELNGPSKSNNDAGDSTRNLKNENIANKRKKDNTTDVSQKLNKKKRVTSIEFNTIDDDHQNGAVENPFDEHNLPINKAIDPEEIVTHVEDPFFITESGENYLSTAVITRNSNNDQKSYMDDFRRTPKPRNENFAKQRPNNARNGKQEASRNIKQEVPRHSNNSQPVTTTENLHPSWAAKQKFKPVISNLHGKKITFGDDDDLKPTKITECNVNAKSFKKDSSKTSNNDEAQQLHPSWAAKQKLKPTITVFQGKKITFDAADD